MHNIFRKSRKSALESSLYLLVFSLIDTNTKTRSVYLLHRSELHLFSSKSYNEEGGMLPKNPCVIDFCGIELHALPYSAQMQLHDAINLGILLKEWIFYMRWSHFTAHAENKMYDNL